MITDPTEMLARQIAKSRTGRRCHYCNHHIQVLRAEGRTLIMEAYESEDGEYSIMADCETAYRTTQGPSRFKLHLC